MRFPIEIVVAKKWGAKKWEPGRRADGIVLIFCPPFFAKTTCSTANPPQAWPIKFDRPDAVAQPVK